MRREKAIAQGDHIDDSNTRNEGKAASTSSDNDSDSDSLKHSNSDDTTSTKIENSTSTHEQNDYEGELGTYEANDADKSDNPSASVKKVVTATAAE